VKNQRNKYGVALLGLASLAVVNANAAVPAAITTAIADASAVFNAVFAAGIVITVTMIGWRFLKRIKGS